MIRVHTPACTLILALAIAVGAARADYKSDIGWTKLQAEVGGSLPNGTGVPVTQVEAPESAGNYGPNPASPEFTGKTLTFKSGAAGNSGHATTVASYYYGLNGSIAPGITTIDVYEVNNWLGNGFLRKGSVFSPNAEPNAIQSHSWIGSFDSGGTNDMEVLRRFDSAIQQSEFLGIVGLNNFAANNVPALLAGNYNGISVGRSDSFHSYGTNTADGTGRTKPELVAPFDATSWATPSVAATAAMLRQNAPANGKKVVSLKSILLAGATKHQFSGWSRTLTRPIDSVFGAGQLSAYSLLAVAGAGPCGASQIGRWSESDAVQNEVDLSKGFNSLRDYGINVLIVTNIHRQQKLCPNRLDKFRNLVVILRTITRIRQMGKTNLRTFTMQIVRNSPCNGPLIRDPQNNSLLARE